MYTVRVMPIARGVFKDSLTFFSKEPLSVGSVIQTTIRGRKVPGLVLESKDALEERMELRGARFTLKKIPATTKARRIFSNAFIEGTRETASWHGVTHGLIMATLTNEAVLSSSAKIDEASSETRAPRGADARADFLVFQADRSERVRTYRNLAREAFARNASILLLAPTAAETESLSEELKRGIEEHVIIISGELPKRTLIHNWNRALNAASPVAIVGTAFALSHPRSDIDTVVIERESARSYRGMQLPHLDVRRAARAITRENGARLILADFPLRIETRYLVDIHRAEELARSQVRPSSGAKLTIVDERKLEEKRGEKRIFQVLENSTKATIQSEIKKGGRVVVYAARRGIAPLTVCNDCGTPVTDPTSGAPMSLHKTERGNVFISHRSGAVLPGNSTCKTCGGWNLVTLGIGIDRVEAEVAKSFPESSLFVLTKDSAPTHQKAKKIADAFYKSSGALMIGTERMLPYLRDPVETVVVASVDSMLGRTEWRSDEHALSILFYLFELAESNLIVETRKPDHEVIKTLSQGNPSDFYRAQLSERERYSYPPFTVFIGLRWHGTENACKKAALLVKETFKDFDLVGPLPAESLGKSDWVQRAVIRVPLGEWPHKEIAERLHNLPPHIAVTIDPDEIV